MRDGGQLAHADTREVQRSVTGRAPPAFWYPPMTCTFLPRGVFPVVTLRVC